MSNRDDCTGVLRKMLLEPEHALSIEVVSWFIEEEQVGFFEEQFAEGNSALLTTRQHVDS